MMVLNKSIPRYGLHLSNIRISLKRRQVVTEEKVVDPNITSEDKTWALLAYILTPIVPIILLFMEDKKNRPFLKAHYPQALAWGIVVWVLTIPLSFVFIGFCVGLFGLVMEIIWGIKAYNGEYVEIPVITNFVRKQGWA
jgi:uncharacterized membrane protein